MSKLVVSDLRAAVGGQEILRGVDLEVESGQVHAVMGPNGSGKSTLAHVIMGKPSYDVLGGSVTLDGTELLDLPTWKRAQAGLFLALQYPTEVPGVPLEQALVEAVRARGDGDVGGVHQRLADEAVRVGLDARFLDRALNVDFSGGEKKRNETVQLGVLRPKIALLDEIDSGLDIDALRAVSRRVEDETRENNLGVLVITHYSRVLRELQPDVVSVLWKGRLVASGGPELADELERTGYAGYDDEQEETSSDPAPGDASADPFADPLL